MVSPEQFEAFVHGKKLPGEVVRQIDRELGDPASEVARLCSEAASSLRLLVGWPAGRDAGDAQGGAAAVESPLTRNQVKRFIHGGEVSGDVHRQLQRDLDNPASLVSRISREYTLLARMFSDPEGPVFGPLPSELPEQEEPHVKMHQIIDFLHGDRVPDVIGRQIKVYLEDPGSGASRLCRYYVRILAEELYPDVLNKL